MSELMKEAIELLNDTNEKFSKIADALSDNVASEDFQKVNNARILTQEHIGRVTLPLVMDNN